jgi:nucleotide-binding universal stress UspA family protein
VATVRPEQSAGSVAECVRYQSIYIPFDNSAHAMQGLDLGVAIARKTGARITGSHVYAAGLHDRRFRQMESGLPDRYLVEDKLVEQREIHDDLITRGLTIISDSYLDVFGDKCRAAGVAGERVLLDGRNWQQLVQDIEASSHDLVIMGALGLGAVEGSVLGSVCERVARRIRRDLLVVKSLERNPAGAIVVALDGSAQSYGALKAALALGRMLDRPVEAISAFDPFFHYVAFNSIAKVLSAEAARVFRFQEQEKLHEEIIDSGLAKIYQANLELARKVAAEEGVELKTTLLAGKPFQQILKYVRETGPWLLVVGRIGIHSDPGMDLGSNTENVLRMSPCNVLLAAGVFEPPLEAIADTTIAWSKESAARMERVPQHARGMAKKAVIQYAVKRGHTVITSDVIDACLAKLMPPGAREAMAAVVESDGRGRCPFDHRAKPRAAGEETTWEREALLALDQIADLTVREHERLRIEKLARRSGERVVTRTMVAAARAAATHES